MVPGREVPKEFRGLIKALMSQGWRYHYKRGHPALIPPDKQHSRIVFSLTPGDVRSLKNVRADVKRRGGQI